MKHRTKKGQSCLESSLSLTTYYFVSSFGLVVSFSEIDVQDHFFDCVASPGAGRILLLLLGPTVVSVPVSC
jgi:hypothetical protein